MRRQRRLLYIAASAMAVILADRAEASDPKLLAYGRHLSGECSACHRNDGVDNGIPSIISRDPEEFAETLGFYRSGARTNPAMVSVAQSLDDAQVKALAAYFGSLPKPAATTNKSKKK